MFVPILGSCKICMDISSEKKNNKILNNILMPQHIMMDCLTILPMVPVSPLICSAAVSREMVVVNPAAVMLHDNVYKGSMS